MAILRQRPDPVYVKVKPIVAGTLTLPEFAFISPVDPSIKHGVPSMCFLVEHPTIARDHQPDGSDKPSTRLMFDLGLRGRPEDYIPEIQAHLPNRYPVAHQPSAPETLKKNGVPPESIESVILSHVHWDHHGDPHDFPNAVFLVGNGSMHVLEHGMPGRGSHSYFDPRMFDNVEVVELSPATVGSSAVDPVVKLSPPNASLNSDASLEASFPGRNILQGDPKWESFPPFSAALDLFGDGSVYVIPSPGHLPGHIMLLCRTGPQEWTLLGGDTFHDTRLLTGEKSISTWEQDGKSYCVHIDKDEAARSIERIRELSSICERDGVKLEVIVAHDNGWYESNMHRFMT